MLCPKCKNPNTKVLDSRVSENGKVIKRRRECEDCEHRFTTLEKIEFVKFFVAKGDGTKKPYNREKLLKSINIAINKREIEPKVIEEMLDDLERTWASNKEKITTKRIGKDVLQYLKKLDKVAYIRFASVYHNFESEDDFIDLIKEK